MIEKYFSPFPNLKTDRLLLRKIAPGDASEIFILRSDRNVNKYIDRQPSRSIEEATAFIQSIIEHISNNSTFYWAVVLADSNKLVGTICLFNFSDDHLRAEIGYELMPSFQGKGLMTEAVSEVIVFALQRMGLHSLEAHARADNLRSIRLLQKLHFTNIGQDENNFLIFQLTGNA